MSKKHFYGRVAAEEIFSDYLRRTFTTPEETFSDDLTRSFARGVDHYMTAGGDNGSRGRVPSAVWDRKSGLFAVFAAGRQKKAEISNYSLSFRCCAHFYGRAGGRGEF